MDVKTNLKKLWNYLTDAFAQEEIVAGFGTQWKALSMTPPQSMIK